MNPPRQSGMEKMGKVFDFMRDISWFIGIILLVTFWITNQSGANREELLQIKNDVRVIKENHLVHIQSTYEKLSEDFEAYKKDEGEDWEDVKSSIELLRIAIVKLETKLE
jgi:hypothetical protein